MQGPIETIETIGTIGTILLLISDCQANGIVRKFGYAHWPRGTI